MGAWGFEIMASDDALDELDAMKDIVGREMDDDNEDAYYEEFTDDELNKNMKELLKMKYYDKNTFWRVLAYQIVTSGADMPTKVRIEIESATIEDCSGWTEPEERKRHLMELRKAVDIYENGKPIALGEDEGLLSKIAKGMN